MAAEEDALRPSRSETQHMLARSHQTWLSYTESTTQLPPDCTKLRNVLGRVPAFLASGSGKLCDYAPFKTRHFRSHGNSSALYVNGQSKWDISSGDCYLREKVMEHELLLGWSLSTRCDFTENSYLVDWPGVQDEERTPVQGNYLAILSFAWAYILSALWIEMQQSKDTEPPMTQRDERMQYLSAQASWTSNSDEERPGDIEVDLGDVGDSAARWWAAILATGEGWRATICRDGNVFQSPWSISLAAAKGFKLQRTVHDHNLDYQMQSPPSSNTALKFLSDFCILHHTCSQPSAALAATLTFPFLGGGNARLPVPRPQLRPILREVISTPSSTMSNPPGTSPSSLMTSQATDIVFEEGKLLSYYMTLSCDCRGMQSLLIGSFFDPEVYCNLVSPWLKPIFSIIDPILKSGDYGSFVTIMSKRQPKMASLWLGATISGMAQIIIPYIRTGSFSVELHASAWTATTHSFISLKPMVHRATSDLKICRSEECRLLYLAESEGYSRVPLCPWKPFGTTALKDTELEVQEHASCSGHYLRYSGWRWELCDGMSPLDSGFDSSMSFMEAFSSTDNGILSEEPEGRLNKSDDLSESATRSIFSWLRVTGYPRSERNIRRHSWIDLEDSDDDELDDDARTDDIKLRDPAYISNWIDSVLI